MKDLKDGGNDKKYLDSLFSFAENNVNSAEIISEYVKNSDLDNAYRESHKLKGITGNLSITDVYKEAVRIDDLLKSGKINGIESMISSLRKAMDIAVTAIRKFEKSYIQEEIVPKELNIAGSIGIFKKMLKAYDSYNHDEVELYLEKLDCMLPRQATKDIRSKIENFKFREAKIETLKLIKILGINLEENLNG